VDIPSELSKAERLIAAGQLEEAKAVLRGILAQDKRNAAAWYLVAQSVADPRAKAEALRRTLLTDPDHPRAKREFEAMDGLAILQPPSMTKSTPATPDVPPRKTSADVTPKRRIPFVPLLISAGVVLVVLIGLALVAARPSNSPTPTVLALAASASPIVPAVVQTTPTALPTATAIPSTPTPIPNGLPTAGDALAQTATAIQQNIAATGTGLVQVAGNKTQVAALTQTATQQGALGATVAAQQTSIAALGALPGTLIVLGDNTQHVTASNVQFVSFAGMIGLNLAPDGRHIAYGKTGVNGSFVANRDGSNERAITGLPNGVDLNTSDTRLWSPDGNWLLLIPSSGLNAKCYIISLTDGVAHTITVPTSKPSDVQHTLVLPAWSPSSQRLALFDRVNNGMINEETRLYVMNMAQIDAAPTSVPLISTVGTPAFSTPRTIYSALLWLDEQQVLASKEVSQTGVTASNSSLIAVDVTTHTLRVFHSFPATELHQMMTVTLSPDGHHLAFTALSSTGTGVLVYILTPDGNVLKIIPDLSLDAKFSWSPDSKLLGLPGSETRSARQIAWLKLDDLSLHQALPGTAGLAFPLWSPDSHALLICQSSNATNGSGPQGKALLLPIAAGSTPLALFDTRSSGRERGINRDEGLERRRRVTRGQDS